MKTIALSALMLGLGIAAPAAALEYETIIDHANGTIAADYNGSIEVETRTVGTANIPGRRKTQRCMYTVSIAVERTASLGSAFETRRAMSRDDVIIGSLPGRCSTQQVRIADLVDARNSDLQVALMELVEQDRQVLIAQADSAGIDPRGT